MTGLSSTVVELMWNIVFRLFQILGMKISANKSLAEEYQHSHLKILSSTPARKGSRFWHCKSMGQAHSVLLICIYIGSHCHNHDQATKPCHSRQRGRDIIVEWSFQEVESLDLFHAANGKYYLYKRWYWVSGSNKCISLCSWWSLDPLTKTMSWSLLLAMMPNHTCLHSSKA